MDYRTKDSITVIRFPSGFDEEKRKKCPSCCRDKQLVLAHPTDVEIYKNDVKGVFVKRGSEADIVTFIMEDDNGTVLSNLGDSATFPNDDLAVGFIYSWKQVINTYGQGCYTIKVSFTVAGVDGEFTIGKFTLKEYSISTARHTVKIHTNFNSYYLKDKVDFTDSNFVDSVRFNGYFGDRQPNTEISNLIGVGRKIEKVTRENLNAYELRTDPLSVCVTRQLVDFHFVNEDSILISDHNPSNHSYLYLDTDVVIEETPKIEYTDGNRLAKITAIFGDRFKKEKSYYNKQ